MVHGEKLVAWLISFSFVAHVQVGKLHLYYFILVHLVYFFGDVIQVPLHPVST